MATKPDKEALLKMINEMDDSTPETSEEKKKFIKGPAKVITLAILVLAFIVGVFGSFELASFDMDSYVQFLDAFAWFFSPLILSIGVGSSTKKIGEVLQARVSAKETTAEGE